jgi:hypothetical protein
MADVAANLYDWSTTASSNNPAGSTNIGAGLDDNLRELQKVVRQDLAHKGADIASATTTDLGAVVGLMHDITGTTTITGFGTVSAGIWKLVKFEGALTLTHNATSLILPNAANITTADGDTALAFSEGSGNWRIHSYAGKNAYHSTLTTSGAATVGGNLVVSGTGRVDGILGGDGTDLSLGGSTATEQVRVTHTASATRYITMTGSNGANPALAVSAGSLDICTGALTVVLAANPVNINNIGVIIGGSTGRSTTDGTYTLMIRDGTAPVGTMSTGVQLYSTAGELRVMDAAGNPTLLSPHDKDGYWVFESRSGETGKMFTVHMERLIRKLNEQLGGGFIDECDLAALGIN